jgi:hypothetical protein
VAPADVRRADTGQQAGRAPAGGGSHGWRPEQRLTGSASVTLGPRVARFDRAQERVDHTAGVGQGVGEGGERLLHPLHLVADSREGTRRRRARLPLPELATQVLHFALIFPGVPQHRFGLGQKVEAMHFEDVAPVAGAALVPADQGGGDAAPAIGD